MPTFPLTNTTGLVTGASRGFGRAISVALAAQGVHVVGVARNQTALADLEDELGSAFTGIVADVTDESLAPRLVAEHQPQLLVLNAGATPHPAPLQDQTWETFSINWSTDVRHAFEFTKAALDAPLPPGSSVISVSSGAARMGSPLSGGYAGAKATVAFISDYARAQSERRGLDIRFASLLPKITGATALGSTFIDAYAEYGDLSREAYLAQLGAALTAEQVAAAVLELATADDAEAPSYLLTAGGLQALA